MKKYQIEVTLGREHKVTYRGETDDISAACDSTGPLEKLTRENPDYIDLKITEDGKPVTWEYLFQLNRKLGRTPEAD